MSDLSPETRKLLDLARDGESLPARKRALLEHKLFTRAAAGGIVVGLVAREALGGSTALFGPIAKGLAGLAIVSSVGAGGYLAVRAVQHNAVAVSSPHVAPQPPKAPIEWTAPATRSMAAAPARPARPADTEAPRKAKVVEPTARRAPAVRSSRAQSAPSKASSESAPAAAAPETTAAPVQPAPAEEAQAVRAPNTLAEETRLIWEADQALRSGNSSRAVVLLDEHASRYPDGALGPERGGERVVALCKLDRIDAATVRGYLSSHPNLSLADRVQQACARILARSK